MREPVHKIRQNRAGECASWQAKLLVPMVDLIWTAGHVRDTTAKKMAFLSTTFLFIKDARAVYEIILQWLLLVKFGPTAVVMWS